MIKMSAFSSFFVCHFVCIFVAFLSGRVKRVQLPRVGGPCLRRFVWLKEYVSCVNYLLLLVRGFWFLNLVISVCIRGSIGHWFIVLVHRVGLWPLLLTFALQDWFSILHSVFSHRAFLFFSFLFALLFLLFSKSYPHLLLLTESLTFEILTFRLFSWSISLSLFKHGLLLPLACCQSTRIQNTFCKQCRSYFPEEIS